MTNPNMHYQGGGGITIREHFALEIYKTLMLNPGALVQPDPTFCVEEHAVKLADELIGELNRGV